MKKVLLSIITVVSISCYAQLVPNKQLHLSTPSGYASYRDVVTDNSGNIYTVGYAPANTDIDPGPGVVNSGTVAVDFVSKYNPNTQTLNWSVTYPNTGFVGILNAIDLNSLNEVFVIGTAFSGLDLDPGVATSTITGSQSSVIIKFDNNGNYINFKQLHNASTFGIDIEIDNSDNIYIGGSGNGTVNFDNGVTNYSLTTQGWDFLVAKYTSTYGFVWANVFGSPSSETYKDIEQLQLDGSGNLYLTSKIANTATIAGTSLTALSEFVLKINPLGQIVNCFKFDISSGLGNRYLKLDVFANGKFYASGGYTGNVDLDPTSGTAVKTNTTSAADQFVGFYESTGIPVWIYTFNNWIGENFYSSAADGNKNIYLWGNYDPATDYDKNSGTFSFPNTNPVPNYMIVSYDSLGNIHGGRTFMNGIDPNYESVMRMINNENGILFMGASGSFGSTVDYAPGNPVMNINVTGGSNGIITTYDFCGSASQATLTPSICAGATYTLPTGSSVTTAGTYTSNLVSYWGCDSIIYTNLTVNPLPIINVNSGSICTGQSFTISPTGANTYTISNGNNTIVSPTNSTSYSITGTSTFGCVSSNTVISSVIVNPLPNVFASTSNTLLCIGQTATISATGANSFTWSTTENGSNIIVSPTVTTTYSVIGTDANGCSNSSTITQSVSLCTGIEQLENESIVSAFPNPFTDVLTIKHSFDNSDIIIVDVLGKIVFEKQLKTTETSIDLDHLTKGVYQLILKGNNNSRTLKIIKQ
ncbi:MAG: T9SS type A sorting domain-containing protein [Bacteroidia bacterium]